MRNLILAFTLAAMVAGCTNRHSDSPVLAGLPPANEDSSIGMAAPAIDLSANETAGAPP